MQMVIEQKTQSRRQVIQIGYTIDFIISLLIILIVWFLMSFRLWRMEILLKEKTGFLILNRCSNFLAMRMFLLI